MTELPKKDKKGLLRWFMLATFHGYYSSRTDTKLDDDLQEIGKAPSPWERLIEHMVDRGFRDKITTNELQKGLEMNVLRLQGRAFLFLLYTLLVKNGADDWNGSRVDRGPFSRLARHHIFPRDFLETNLDVEDPDQKEVQISNVGNLTFIHESINCEIGDTEPREYLKDYAESLEAHFIPAKRELWTIGSYPEFLAKRASLMASTGQRHFPEVFE